MKKAFVLLLFLSTSITFSQICTSVCTFRIGNSNFTYGYAWYVPNGELCTSHSPPNTQVGYAIGMSCAYCRTVTIIDQGVCDSSEARC